MKRSEVNAILRDSEAFCRERRFELPPFAFWSLDDWRKRASETDEIRTCQLGWDITDFGQGDFWNLGLVLFTLRNGDNTPKYPKPYAEKILICEEGQVTPMHFHWNKMEDIINRGGGDLDIVLHNADDQEQFADTPVVVTCDGLERATPAGGAIALKPGESVSLPTRLYHEFCVAKGTGKTLLGEVSKVNDDTSDNRFFKPVGRFPEVEEDEAPLYLLGCDYDKFL